MAHRLDVVAVQVMYEGSIVVAMVLRTEARRAVIDTARSKRSLIESIDLLARPRPESKMTTLARHLGLQQAELSSRVFTRNRLHPTKQHAVIVELLAYVHSKWFQHSRGLLWDGIRTHLKLTWRRRSGYSSPRIQK